VSHYAAAGFFSTSVFVFYAQVYCHYRTLVTHLQFAKMRLEVDLRLFAGVSAQQLTSYHFSRAHRKHTAEKDKVSAAQRANNGNL